ncbi:hypothetical protein SO694_00164045 [Aureococcus anophagefferens]|uniref:Uncharacterized protein n=1 Tax=Aureococcus anophagefferens TaxID=44056 RepID=A0ABR1G656_AURAN
MADAETDGGTRSESEQASGDEGASGSDDAPEPSPRRTTRLSAKTSTQSFAPQPCPWRAASTGSRGRRAAARRPRPPRLAAGSRPRPTTESARRPARDLRRVMAPELLEAHAERCATEAFAGGAAPPAPRAPRPRASAASSRRRDHLDRAGDDRRRPSSSPSSTRCAAAHPAPVIPQPLAAAAQDAAAEEARPPRAARGAAGRAGDAEVLTVHAGITVELRDVAAANPAMVPAVEAADERLRRLPESALVFHERPGEPDLRKNVEWQRLVAEEDALLRSYAGKRRKKPQSGDPAGKRARARAPPRPGTAARAARGAQAHARRRELLRRLADAARLPRGAYAANDGRCRLLARVAYKAEIASENAAAREYIGRMQHVHRLDASVIDRAFASELKDYQDGRATRTPSAGRRQRARAAARRLPRCAPAARASVPTAFFGAHENGARDIGWAVPSTVMLAPAHAQAIAAIAKGGQARCAGRRRRQGASAAALRGLRAAAGAAAPGPAPGLGPPPAGRPARRRHGRGQAYGTGPRRRQRRRSRRRRGGPRRRRGSRCPGAPAAPSTPPCGPWATASRPCSASSPRRAPSPTPRRFRAATLGAREDGRGGARRLPRDAATFALFADVAAKAAVALATNAAADDDLVAALAAFGAAAGAAATPLLARVIGLLPDATTVQSRVYVARMRKPTALAEVADAQDLLFADGGAEAAPMDTSA